MHGIACEDFGGHTNPPVGLILLHSECIIATIGYATVLWSLLLMARHGQASASPVGRKGGVSFQMRLQAVQVS